MDRLSFSMADAKENTYHSFIQALRSRLTAGRPLSHGIPVLPAREDVPVDRRFLLVDLTDYQGNTITVAIDVVNAYVVGYAAGGKSYFLQDNVTNPQHRPPIETLFPETKRAPPLHFDGSYGGLARGAGEGALPDPGKAPVLERTGLGRRELDNAIKNLFFAENQSLLATGFIVIVQMLSEAARFKTIEYLIRIRMGVDNVPCTRDFLVESLELNWSNLSEQIQRVPADQTAFQRSIKLRNNKNEPYQINSVDHDMVQRQGITMLLHDGGT